MATGRGHVQQLDNYGVRGWALNDAERYAILDILVNGSSVAKVAAGTFSSALAEALSNDGYCAFNYRFEPPIAVDADASVEVRMVATGEALLDGLQIVPQAFGDGAAYPLAIDAEFQSAFPLGMSVEGGMARGGAIFYGVKPPTAAVSKDPAVSVLDFVVAPVPDLPSQVGWLRSTVKRHTARYSLRLPAGYSSPTIALQFESEPQSSAGAAQSISPPEVVHALRSDWHTLPPQPNQYRIGGSDSDDNSFVIIGVQTAAVIDRVLGAYGFPSHGLKILDWGVGSGRVAVPLKRLFRPNDEVVGVDIDQVNVDWSRTNLPDIDVRLGDIYPPLDFPDASFDAVFGISVMTHLPEGTQQIWLRELRRILRPGGLAILTVHGDHSLLSVAPWTELVRDLHRFGIHDASRDDAIQVSERGYYRTTYQLRGQIADRWSTVMPIVAFLPRCNAAQDWVVLRRE